jgi:hypothetical protein
MIPITLCRRCRRNRTTLTDRDKLFRSTQRLIFAAGFWTHILPNCWRIREDRSRGVTVQPQSPSQVRRNRRETCRQFTRDKHY